MRLFVSAGEPSGDLHGSNLVRALRRRRPDAEIHGFGGERMDRAGCRLLYPLCDFAVIGFVRVVASLPRFARFLDMADRFFREQRPDALVLIDFPGFHWWLARRARKYNIPVYYFVPPQIWAWAPWRANKMRRLVDHVLCALLFEEAWFRERRIPATYIGHPYFDDLHALRLDGAFVAAQRARPERIVALLPGSRGHELEDNVPSLFRAAALIHARRPDVRFLVACLNDKHRRLVEERLAGRDLPIEVHAGKTAEIIHLAHSCLAVSGSVGLELLYHGRPSVVVYRSGWLILQIARVLRQCPHISLVNLLAEKELYPEFLTHLCPAEGMAERVLHWLNDRPAYEALCGELAALRNQVAEPGACDRAAGFLLEAVQGRAAGRRAG